MADPVAPTLSITYLKDIELGAAKYLTLTDNNNDAIATAKLEQSKLWAKSKYDNAGVDYDETVDIVKQAIMQMTVAHLYLRNNQEEVSQKYKDMAEEMLKTAIGNSALGGNKDLPSVPAVNITLNPSILFADSNNLGGYGPGENY